MQRLFSGLEIPQSLASHLGLLKGGLPGARWMDDTGYHITLRYLGEVDDHVAREFFGALDLIKMKRFDLRLTTLDCFGGARPRTIYAGVEPSTQLARLHMAHETAARAVGCPPEGRNFTPHVTVARLTKTKPANVARYLAAHGGFFSAPFEVSRFVVLSSRLSTGGGPYSTEVVFDLE